MDAKKARETLTKLCAEWDRAGGVMNRYIRPAGFSLALGVGVAAGAGCGSSSSTVEDALPAPKDAASEVLPIGVDAYGVIVDAYVPLADIRDALPPAPDVYGVIMDVYVPPVDGSPMDIARDALPLARDAYGITMSDVLPPALVDAPPSDAQDALPTDGGTMAAPDALPPAPDVYGVVDVFQPTGGADGGARD